MDWVLIFMLMVFIFMLSVSLLPIDLHASFTLAARFFFSYTPRFSRYSHDFPFYAGVPGVMLPVCFLMLTVLFFMLSPPPFMLRGAGGRGGGVHDPFVF